MSEEIVLRQATVEGCVAPGRARRSVQAPVAAPDPHLERLQAGYEQGLREGREAARRDGHAQGLEEGRSQAAAALAAAIESAVQTATAALAVRERDLAAAAVALRSAVEDVRAAAEEEMVAVCHGTLCRLVADALADADGVRALVRHNLAQWESRAPITVCVHPDHLRACSAAEDGVVTWRADARVGPGGCIVHRDEGALDFRLETVLREITVALLAGRGTKA